MARPAEHQNNMLSESESTTPRVLERSVFWIAYVLGTLILVFAFLLAQAPRGGNKDFILDYICWSSSGSLMITCILVARHVRKKGRNITQIAAGVGEYVVTGAAWVELAFSLYGILSFATSR
jgi:hypothetical protein